MPQFLGGHTAFLLREQVEVAIVVVAGIGMIEEGQGSGLVGSVDHLVVPVGHHDLAVGILRRHQQEYHVVENLLDLGRILGGQPVHALDDHLRRADFGGVNVVGDEDDRLPGLEYFVALRVCRRAALEVELALQALVLVEVFQVLRGTDFQHHEGIPVGGGAQVAITDAVRFIGDLLEILDRFVVADQLFISADAEAEIGLGSLDGSRCQANTQHGKNRQTRGS